MLYREIIAVCSEVGNDNDDDDDDDDEIKVNAGGIINNDAKIIACNHIQGVICHGPRMSI
jgi:hypothetical protein